MNSQDVGLRVASVLFGILAVLQALRLAVRPEVVVNGLMTDSKNSLSH